MYLLYLDESGEDRNPTDHFVVGGLAIRAHDIGALRKIVQNTKAKHLHPHLLGLELHAQHVRSGKDAWRRIPKEVRFNLLGDLGRRLSRFNSREGSNKFALFAVACDPNFSPPEGRLKRTYEEILLRFQEMLVRIDRQEGRRERNDHSLGLVVADEAKYERVVQPVVREWRDSGTRFKRLSRIVEVPLFVESAATEPIQLADYVAHATYRLYHAEDDSLMDPLRPAFDQCDGRLHGLVHLTPAHRSCSCAACANRSSRSAR